MQGLFHDCAVSLMGQFPLLRGISGVQGQTEASG